MEGRERCNTLTTHENYDCQKKNIYIYLVHIEIDLSPLWKLKIEKYFWMLGLFLW